MVVLVQRLEGAHVGFLRQITRKKSKWLRDGLWWQVTAKKFLQGAGTQPLQTYVDRRQATVAEWVALRPIFDICAREMGYEGGGRLWVPWWRQAAAEKQLKVTVEAVWEAARVRRQQKPVRRGRTEGWSELGSTDSEG